MPNRILIVEDDRSIAELLAYVLRKEGYETAMALTGHEGIRLLAEGADLLLLDWSLPDISGLDICRRVTATTRIPVIMLTAKNLMEDKILGLEIGADDYITKPFDIREVLVRIKAVLRRLEAAPPAEAPAARPDILIAHVRVDPNTQSVWSGEALAELTPLEYKLLLYLYDNRNQVLSRDQILNAVWGYEYLGNSRTVDIHIVRLRKKLNLSAQIQTVFKSGYRLML